MRYKTGIQPKNVSGKSGSLEAASFCLFLAAYRPFHRGRKNCKVAHVSDRRIRIARKTYTETEECAEPQSYGDDQLGDNFSDDVFVIGGLRSGLRSPDRSHYGVIAVCLSLHDDIIGKA